MEYASENSIYHNAFRGLYFIAEGHWRAIVRSISNTHVVILLMILECFGASEHLTQCWFQRIKRIERYDCRTDWQSLLYCICKKKNFVPDGTELAFTQPYQGMLSVVFLLE